MTSDGGDAPGACRPPEERAAELIRIFCPNLGRFGRIESIRPEEVPAPARDLLDHRGHMTVTMERFHACKVRLQVLREAGKAAANPPYAREILLVRPDGAVVQYGIVRIDLGSVGPQVAASVRAGEAPLGRVLLEAGLLCEVENVALLLVEPGPHLREAIGRTDGNACVFFGRAAEIRVQGRPTIELLEVAVPTWPSAGAGAS